MKLIVCAILLLGALSPAAADSFEEKEEATISDSYEEKAEAAKTKLLKTHDDQLKLRATVYDFPETCEPKVKEGDYVTVHVVTSIHNKSFVGVPGKAISSTRDSGKAAVVRAGFGSDDSLEALQRAVVGLCVGAKAEIDSPSRFAYSDIGYLNQAGIHIIPPYARMAFDIEVLEISNSHPDDPNIFLEMDSNRDVFITFKEYQTWFAQNHPKLWHTFEKDTTGLKKGPIEMFGKWDVDGDYQLSWDEFQLPKGDEAPEKVDIFGIVDTNGDGNLDFDELKSLVGRDALKEDMKRKLDKFGNKNRIGNIDSAYGMQMPSVREMRAKFDLNMDGIIDREEFSYLEDQAEAREYNMFDESYVGGSVLSEGFAVYNQMSPSEKEEFLKRTGVQKETLEMAAQQHGVEL